MVNVNYLGHNSTGMQNIWTRRLLYMMYQMNGVFSWLSGTVRQALQRLSHISGFQTVVYHDDFRGSHQHQHQHQ